MYVEYVLESVQHGLDEKSIRPDTEPNITGSAVCSLPRTVRPLIRADQSITCQSMLAQRPAGCRRLPDRQIKSNPLNAILHALLIKYC